MAYQALYRKYRPTTFSDVVGQEHITETLKSGISEGKVVHAYLFTGTRGTGKTSCAKILAKAVNCLNPINGDPCGECEICRAIAEDTVTDIAEIDAASNRGIESIRALREQVAFSPATAKYRVYIIDEVHMLTTEAFNALLKTLEEPPEHVIFILATTEVHKLPATILSRCQRYDFRRIDSEVIKSRILKVAESEPFTVTESAATLIANIADGGMRDALSILDLCAAAESNITEETVISVCSMAGNDYLLKMADLIKKCDTENALLLVDELHSSSVDMQRFIPELIRHFRDLMIIKTVKVGKPPVVCSEKRLDELKNQSKSFELTEIISILNILQNSAASLQSGNGRVVAEMAIVRLCNPEIRLDASSLEKRIAALESGIVKSPANHYERTSENATTESVFEKVTQEEKKEEKPVTDNSQQEKAETKAENGDEPTPLNEWQDIIYVLQETCPLIAGILNSSRAFIKGNYILIDTANEQFRSLCNGSDPVYRNAIKQAAEKILGKQFGLGPYRKPTVSKEEDPLAAFAEKLNTMK